MKEVILITVPTKNLIFFNLTDQARQPVLKNDE